MNWLLGEAVSAAGFDWGHEFRAFTPFHWVTTGVCLAAMVASSCLGVVWRGDRRELLLRKSWAWVVLGTQVVLLVYYFMPPFDFRRALPLHICDVSGWIAGLALLTQKRWMRVLLYYWGICLSTQAFITPVLGGPGTGYETPSFWAFWGLHLMIVGSAVYDLVVLRYRPVWRDLKLGIILSAIYVNSVLVFNLVFDANYIYTGKSKPEFPTLIDKLGPWPWRVLLLYAICAAGFTLFTAVWPCNWKRRGGAAA